MKQNVQNIPLSEVIHQRREQVWIRNEYWNLFTRIVLIVALLGVTFTQIFILARADGNDMFPTIRDGDVMIGYRLQEEYVQDDVVIYEEDNQIQTGRIVAKAGDVINIDESGTVMVNGAILSGEITFPTYSKGGIEYPYTIPDNAYFILKDYRTQAQDSRNYGCINRNNVKAKVITFVRRRSI